MQCALVTSHSYNLHPTYDSNIQYLLNNILYNVKKTILFTLKMANSCLHRT